MSDQKTIVGQTVAEVADVVDGKVTKVVDATMSQADQFVSRMADLLQQYGPDIADASLSVLRIDAISQFIAPFFGIIASISLLCVVVWTLKRNTYNYDQKYANNRLYQNYYGEWFFVTVLACIGMVIFAVISAVHIARPFLGIISPEYWALVKAGIL